MGKWYNSELDDKVSVRMSVEMGEFWVALGTLSCEMNWVRWVEVGKTTMDVGCCESLVSHNSATSLALNCNRTCRHSFRDVIAIVF